MKKSHALRRNAVSTSITGLTPLLPKYCWQWVAVALVAGGGQRVLAQTDTWDPSLTGPSTGVPADAGGTWNTGTPDWYNATPGTAGGSDVVWPNDGTTIAQFGNPTGIVGSGTAGTVNLATTISAGGLILNMPNAGDYTINTGANSLNLGSAGGLTVNGGNPTINVSSAQSLSDSGMATIGNAAYANTSLTVAGAGSFTATGAGGFAVGNGSTATLTMGGLSNFSYNNTTTGAEFDVGVNSAGTGVVTLATTSSITAPVVRIGDSEGTLTAGSGTLNLGSGSTIINAGAINIGGGSTTGLGSINGPMGTAPEQSSSGTLQFAGSNGTLTVGPVAGATGAQALGPFINIGVGGANGTSVTGSVNLNGHSVNINAASLDMGNRTGGSGNSATGVLSFDTGTINVGTVYMSNDQVSDGGGFATTTLNIGSSPSSTELFDVNGTNYVINTSDFQFGNTSAGVAGYVANATMNIMGGTALINSNIFATQGTSNLTNATINLSGGTLNMNHNEIGGTGAAITFNVTGGTLENVGEIDSNVTASHGLTLSSGSLNLLGVNTWGGTTTINGGTLVAGAVNSMSANAAVALSSGTLDVSGFANKVPSLAITGGALNLGVGNPLTVTGAASLGGTLNLTGAPTGAFVVLMNYASETGTFASAPSFAGYTLTYGSTQLEYANSTLFVTWNNAGGTGDGVTWDTANQNWNNGSPTTFANGDAVTFNDANNAVSNSGTNPNAYNVTLNTTVTPDGVTVNNSAGNYSITGTGSIAGIGALTKSGTGTLTLGTNNTYSGGTNINSGTVIVNAGATLGASTGALVLGTPVAAKGGTTTAVGNLILNSSIGVGSFSSTPDNSTPSVLTINAGDTLTVNGAFTVGPINSNTTVPAVVYNCALTANGGGALVVNGTGNFNVGQTSNNSGGKDTTTVNMSALNSVRVTTTGTFGVGLGQNSAGILMLADTTVASVAPTNFISATEIDVGNSQSNNDGGMSTLSLGSGTNTLNANTINIGIGKTGGIVTWAGDATSASSVSIAGTNGTGTANITLGQATAGTYTSGRLSQLLLAGHVATVKAGTVTIGDSTGDTKTGPNATVTFDTGTFNAQSIILAADTGGTSTTGPIGALTIGGATPNITATGVLTVGSAATPGTFDLGDFTATIAATATPTFTINGGTANIFANITVASNSTTGTTHSALTLAGGGILNMEGNAIGGNGATTSGNQPITTVQLAPNSTDTSTLENLGGAGVNGAGLTMNGAGTLTLLGTNSYIGGTTVNSGKVIVGAGTALPLGAVTISAGMLQLATNVTAGSQMSPTPASDINITTLAISGSGTLDINNNHIIINYGAGADPISSIAALIASGFNGGTWTGTGITSSAAAANSASYGIGYADATDPGNPAGLASGQIEIMYTLLGDANLDGAVNGSDFAIMATNFNKADLAGHSGWSEGDFNYDGSVNGSDFALLASNFNKGASQAADSALDSFASANGLLADVPEPASTGLLVLTGLGVLSRRKRRR